MLHRHGLLFGLAALTVLCVPVKALPKLSKVGLISVRRHGSKNGAFRCEKGDREGCCEGGSVLGLRGGRGRLALKEEKDRENIAVKRKGSLVSIIFVGWLYFLSVALAVPALPRLVNNIMGGKDTVSPQSQMALASIMATDGIFTFLTNNLWGAMSDKYGRKPFMVMSATGIGLGAAIIYSSTALWPMYLAAAIDGCTSCMFGLGQAYTSDISTAKDLPENIGLFMGMLRISLTVQITVGTAVLVSRKCLRQTGVPFDRS